MIEDQEKIAFHCSKCDTTNEYPRKIYDTFSKVRCTNCGESISVIAYKITEQLLRLREMSCKPRTKDWAKAVYAIWVYVLRHCDELQDVDSQMRFDTCVELVKNGLTQLPGLMRDFYKMTFVVPIILTDNFNASPYLPHNPPLLPQPWMLSVFAVHYKVLQGLLEQDEEVIHFEFGGIQLGSTNRIRNGTIVVTTHRLIVIGGEEYDPSGGQFLNIRYPEIQKFTVEVSKVMEFSDWLFTINPEPLSAVIYRSLDYLYLQDLEDLNRVDDTLNCLFLNQEIVSISPLRLFNPLHQIKSLQAGWHIFSSFARQKKTTGNFEISIVLFGDADDERGIPDAITRCVALENAIKNALHSRS